MGNRPPPRYKQMVGGKPVARATLAGQSIDCLLDTGSQVSFVTEAFYKAHLQRDGHLLRSAHHWLTIRAADGLQIPYVGYFEATVAVAGTIVEDRAILVVRDSGQQLPGLLGMNVLTHIPRFAASLSQVANVDATRFARVATRRPICVPARTTAYLQTVGGFPGQTAVLEPLATGCGPLLVTTAAVHGSTFFAAVVNATESDYWVRPRTRLGVLRRGDVITGSVGVDVSTHEIFVGGTPGMSSVAATEEVEVPIDLSAFEGTADELRDVRALFRKHHSVFVGPDDELGCTMAVQHRIRTTDDVPVTMPYRRIPPTQLEEVKAHLQELVHSGAIVPSNSAYASAVVLVRKRTGALRMCCDFRALNAKTVKDAYPLPRIDESMDALAGAQYFSTLDLQSAYMQVPMHPDDAHKTAFTTPFGLFEHRRMAFGLCNAPGTFQRLMQTAFREEMFSILLCYLDDILVFSRTVAEHISRLDTVFTRLAEYGLKLARRKCDFFRREVRYLGHRVSADGIATDPEKVTAVQNWPTPETLKQLRSFLGFAAYYRRYVPRFTSVASPLHALVTACCQDLKGKPRSSASFRLGAGWTEACTLAFASIKEALTTAPVLGFADYRQPFIVETDASDLGLGAVLSQIQEGRTRIIAYASRSLSKAEKNASNYSSKKLELLALKWAVCEKFRDYLLGGQFVLYTDNNPLTYLMKSTKLPAVEQRWAAALAPFHFEIKYRAAKHNANADALSRLAQAGTSLPDVDSCFEELTQTTRLPAALCVNVLEANGPDAVAEDEALGVLPSISRADMRTHQQNDDVLRRVIWFRRQGRRPDDKERPQESKATLALLAMGDKLVERDGVLHRRITTPAGLQRHQLLLPTILRERTLRGLHDEAGHQGCERTEALVRERCYWVGLRADVKRWVERCERCAVAKMPHIKTRTPMGRLMATRPLEVVCVDFTILEPSSDGRENVLVMTDVFTKFTVAVVTRNQRAETVAKALVSQWFTRYGVPQRLHSDNGRNFTSAIVARLSKLYGVQRSHTTPYHPVGNGQCERFNRTLHDLLRTLSAEKKRRWAEHVAELVQAYNSTPHASTGYSPFYLMFGRESRLPIDVLLGVEDSSAAEEGWVLQHQRRLHDAYRLAHARLVSHADERKVRHDRQARELPLAAGEHVYLRNHGVRGRNKIQDSWRRTPYRVVARQGLNEVYVVEPVDGDGEPRTVNRSHLRPCVAGNEPAAAAAPVVRRRRLPCVPSAVSEADDESDSQSAPLLWAVRPPPVRGELPVVHRGEGAPSTRSSSASSSLDSTEDEGSPLPRRSSRATAGCHSNPGNWPRSAV